MRSTLETPAEVRVAVVPVSARTRPAEFGRFFGLVAQHAAVDLREVASFYQERQKSPLQHLQFQGHLRFRFTTDLRGGGALEELMMHRKTFGVIGVCHGPDVGDLGAAHDAFVAAARASTDSRVLRCLVFNPSEGQLAQDTSARKHLITFPKKPWAELRYHVHTIMLDFAAAVLMDLEQRILNANLGSVMMSSAFDVVTTLVGTAAGAKVADPGEAQMEKVRQVDGAGGSKALEKKKHLGRLQKTIADLCLLAGSPRDALQHYNTAQELARLTEDPVWLASILEGTACAVVLQAMPALGYDDAAFTGEVVGDVVELYRESLQLYRRHRFETLEIRALMKLTSFLATTKLPDAQRGLRGGFLRDMILLAPKLADPYDQLLVYLEIAFIFRRLGSPRKVSLWLYKAVLLSRELNTGSLPSVLCPLHDFLAKLPGLAEGGDRATPRALERAIAAGDQWEVVRYSLLEGLFDEAARVGHPAEVQHFGHRLLAEYGGLAPLAVQELVLDCMAEEGGRVALSAPAEAPAVLALEYVDVAAMPAISRLYPLQVVQAADHGPFLYTPFAKQRAAQDRPDQCCLKGEILQLELRVTNPCAVPLRVQRIRLTSTMPKSLAEPAAFTIGAGETRPLRLAFTPLQLGPFRFSGCHVEALGMSWTLAVAGPALPQFEAIEDAPLLLSHLDGAATDDGALELLAGEERTLHVRLTNVSHVAAKVLSLSCSSGRGLAKAVRTELEKDHVPRVLAPAAAARFQVRLRALPLAPGAAALPEGDLDVLVTYCSAAGDHPAAYCRKIALKSAVGVRPGPAVAVVGEVARRGGRVLAQLQVANPGPAALDVLAVRGWGFGPRPDRPLRFRSLRGLGARVPPHGHASLPLMSEEAAGEVAEEAAAGDGDGGGAPPAEVAELPAFEVAWSASAGETAGRRGRAHCWSGELAREAAAGRVRVAVAHAEVSRSAQGEPFAAVLRFDLEVENVGRRPVEAALGVALRRGGGGGWEGRRSPESSEQVLIAGTARGVRAALAPGEALPFSFTAMFLEPGRYAACCFPDAAVGGAGADVRVEQVGGGAVVV